MEYEVGSARVRVNNARRAMRFIDVATRSGADHERLQEGNVTEGPPLGLSASIAGVMRAKRIPIDDQLLANSATIRGRWLGCACMANVWNAFCRSMHGICDPGAPALFSASGSHFFRKKLGYQL